MTLQNTTEMGLSLRPIPDLVHYIAGEFALRISTIWGDGDLGEYLMAPATQRHVWHAALSANADNLPPLSTLREFFTKSRRKDILHAAFANSAPGMINLLSKLEPRAQTTEFYRAAHSALSRGDDLTRILQHADKIDPRMVFGIATLPTDRFTVQIAGYALRRREPDFDIEELSWLGRRIGEFDQSGKIVEAISKSNNPLMAMRKAIANLPFPKAPWAVKDFLPIGSAEELLRVARELDNVLSITTSFTAHASMFRQALRSIIGYREITPCY
jgi:hypothetical protein